MKKLVKLLTLLCVAVMLVSSLTACFSTYGKIESALNNIGYTAIESTDEADDIADESDVAVTAHLLSNADSLKATEIYKVNIVIIFEFKATDDMIELYKDSDTLKGIISDVKADGTAKEFYDALVEKGYANGNCMVFSTNMIVADAVRTAVKNA